MTGKQNFLHLHIIKYEGVKISLITEEVNLCALRTKFHFLRKC